MIEQPKLLKHDTEAPAQRRQLGAFQYRKITPEQGDQSARWALGHENEFEECALAGARRSRQEGKGARVQRKAHIAQDLRPGTVALRKCR